MAGVYDYSKVSNTGNNVFRRHANCDCTVVYDPGDGSKKVQDVWSKRIDYRENIRKNSNFMGAKKPFNMKLGKKRFLLLRIKMTNILISIVKHIRKIQKECVNT